MKVVLGTDRLVWRGGSESYLLTVGEHLRRLGHDVILHVREGDRALARERGLRLVRGDEPLPEGVDGVLVQDAITAYALAERLPEAGQVFVAHSVWHDVQLPPQLPEVCRVAVAMNDRVVARLGALAAPPRVVRLRQPVDLDVFAPQVAARPVARRVLALGNRLTGERRELLEAVCGELGLDLEVAGGAQVTADPASRIADADVVVGIGRCIVEAMAGGRAAYVWDHLGGDGWVTPERYPQLEANGFSGLGEGAVDRARLCEDLSGYTPELGRAGRELALRHHDPRTHAAELVELLREASAPAPGGDVALGELARLTATAWESDLRAISRARRIDELEAALAAERERAARAEAERDRAEAVTRALKSTRRYRATAALVRPLDRLRGRGAHPAPGAPPAGGAPELAVVVFTYRAQPEIVRCVRALRSQTVPVEIVVVNSGGGDAAALLARAGIEDVPVHQTPERLFPGAACNRGLPGTTAPYVRFMAGDLEPGPGWAEAVLRRHRAGAQAVAEAIVPAGRPTPAGLAAYLRMYHSRSPVTPPERAQCFGLSYDRTLFERFGRFREDVRTGEDGDMRQRFAGQVEIAFAPEARSAHDFPPGVPALLRDQYVRGRRAALGYAFGEALDLRALIARNALAGVPRALATGVRLVRGPRDLVTLLAAAPLVVAAALALGAGALRTRFEPPTAPRRRRLILLLQVKDEMRYLPGFLANVAPHVDGIVALDDGSSDGTAELLAARTEVLEVLPAEGDGWDEAANRERLVRAGLRHGADWLLSIDADERLERGFRDRAERLFERADADGESAYFLSLRDVWDDPGRIRVDGVWSAKRKATLFRARADHEFDRSEFHGHWAPLNDHPDGRFPMSGLLVYHLRMLHAADREARRRRYEELDPESRWQAIGYAYLTDPTGMRLAPLPLGREYLPIPDPATEVTGPARRLPRSSVA